MIGFNGFSPYLKGLVWRWLGWCLQTVDPKILWETFLWKIYQFCFQWFLGPTKMYRQSFWMRGFDHFSMKRTILWSTSPAIIAFMQFAHFKGKKDKSPASKSTTRRYINRWGEVAYHGTKDLKRTLSRESIIIYFVRNLVQTFQNTFIDNSSLSNDSISQVL